jgi:hypothetical protein
MSVRAYIDELLLTFLLSTSSFEQVRAQFEQIGGVDDVNAT